MIVEKTSKANPFVWKQTGANRWQWWFIGFPEDPAAFGEVCRHAGNGTYWGSLDQGREQQGFPSWDEAARWVEQTWQAQYRAAKGAN